MYFLFNFQFAVFIVALIGTTLADPKPEPGVLAAAPLVAAPAVAPAVVTATSSQSFIRGYSAPLVATASYVAASPYVPAAPYVAASPYVPAAPYVAASPYVATPYAASPYVASPYIAL